jgi:hypothetical protein
VAAVERKPSTELLKETAMRSAPIRTGAAVVFLALGTSWSDDFAADAAAEPRTAPSTLPAVAPVEFTACVNPGPEFHAGTEEVGAISLPDGEMTITRSRGSTWQSAVHDVSDPRLDGTWYNSFDSDQYASSGGGDPGPEFGTWTHRIENDEGAWQGSGMRIDFADGESLDGPLVLIGEGAYEGLTAVGIIRFGEAPCPNTRGYIIEGGVPAPPVPQTGQ